MFILILIYVCYILGAISSIINNVSDLNDLVCQTRFDTLTTGTLPSNSPENARPYGGCLTIGCKESGEPTIQLFVDSDRKLFRRMNWNGIWSPWGEITTDMPTFYNNYADLSSLANALGVMPYVSQQNVSNIDSWFTYSLVYFEDTVPQGAGTFPYDYNVLVMTIPFQTTLGYNPRFTMQIAFSYNASRASIRFAEQTSYGAWKEFIS